MNPYTLSALIPYFDYMKAIIAENRRRYHNFNQNNQNIYNVLLIDDFNSYFKSRHGSQIHTEFNQGGLRTIWIEYPPNQKYEILAGDIHQYFQKNKVVHMIIPCNNDVIRVNIYDDCEAWGTHVKNLYRVCPDCYYFFQDSKMRPGICSYCRK